MGKKKQFQKKQRTGGPQNWTSVEKENAQWEEYYKQQGLIPEDEWDDFKRHCQTVLPLTFRITGSKKHAIDIRQSMVANYIPDLKGTEWDGVKLPEPEPIKFYPDNLAWTVKVGKQVIRKNQPFARFQRFLVVETDVGHISRQEAVSMIPPLLLDVEPHHAVFDMCAAPGSKTAQLVEALHQVPKPTGFVVANDSDYKRAYMLVHQIKRLNTPNLVVTNHDATLYPRIQLNEYGQPEYLKFDRVLCDVPCSGDATMRKNINVWKDWTVGNALGLHPTQCSILARGIQLLKPGGRLVYSTCSLNPIENEAVVAEALRNYTNVKIVDVSDRLPGLKRSPGVSKWKVQGKDKKWKTLEDAPEMSRSVFEPSEEEAAKFGLEKCVRVYPHYQDTGGFFIVVLEKDDDSNSAEKKQGPKRTAASPSQEQDRPDLKRYKSVDYSVQPQADDVAEAVDGALATPNEYEVEQEPVKATKKDKMPRDANEEPFKFLSPNHATLQSIWKFYEIDSSFNKSSLLVRNATGEPIRTIYYVSPELKNIIVANENRLKLVHSGVKMFSQQKNDGNCKWRVQFEGMELIYDNMGGARVVEASKLDTLRSLCEAGFTRFDDLKQIDEQLYTQVEPMVEGCCFIKLPQEGHADRMVYPLWRGKGSVNVMLPKEYTQELLHRLFKIENAKTEFKNKSNQDPKAQEELGPAVEKLDPESATATDSTPAPDS